MISKSKYYKYIKREKKSKERKEITKNYNLFYIYLDNIYLSDFQ